MTQDEIENFKENIWNKFDISVIDLRYNDLPEDDKIDLMEDAIIRVGQLASELGVSVADFI